MIFNHSFLYFSQWRMTIIITTFMVQIIPRSRQHQSSIPNQSSLISFESTWSLEYDWWPTLLNLKKKVVKNWRKLRLLPADHNCHTFWQLNEKLLLHFPVTTAKCQLVPVYLIILCHYSLSESIFILYLSLFKS